MPKPLAVDGPSYLPAYNWEIGMNDDVAYADRVTWGTSVQMLTEGVGADWDTYSGLEVGNNYDLDPMSEERSKTTFSDGVPEAKGMIGMTGEESTPRMQSGGTMTTVGGKKVVSGPQNYSMTAGMGRKE